MAKNVIQSTSERPDLILEKFIKKLDAFIAQSVANLRKMKSKHTQMNVFWKGQQYDRFTLILDSTLKEAEKELKEMLKLKVQLVKKLQEMRVAMNH